MATPDIRNKANEKIIFEPNVGTTIEIFKGNGSDTATKRYLNFQNAEIMKLIMVANDEFLITEWDGQILDYPIKVFGGSGNQGFLDTRQYFNFSRFKIYTITPNIIIRIQAWGYS